MFLTLLSMSTPYAWYVFKDPSHKDKQTYSYKTLALAKTSVLTGFHLPLTIHIAHQNPFI